MTLTVIINLCFLVAAAFCLVAYFTAYDEKRVRVISRVLFSAAAIGVAGAAVCAFLSEGKSTVFVILGEAAFCLAVLMTAFALGKSPRTAVLRLCLAPLWSMLIVLSSYALSSLNSGSALVIALGIFSALIMTLPSACDFLRLYRYMSADGSIAKERRARNNARAKKREERKNISKKRRELKHGKARK